MRRAAFRSRLRHESATFALIFAAVALSAAGCSRDSGRRAPASGAPLASTAASAKSDADLSRLKHIVVIYMENHSFDNLYGEFPGANGLSSAGDHAKQVDRSGKPYRVLPRQPGHAF